MSRPRSRTRKGSHRISRGSSSLESNWRTEEPSPTTTFRRSLHSTLCSGCAVVFKARLVNVVLTEYSNLHERKIHEPR